MSVLPRRALRRKRRPADVRCYKCWQAFVPARISLATCRWCRERWLRASPDGVLPEAIVDLDKQKPPRTPIREGFTDPSLVKAGTDGRSAQVA